MTNVKQIAAEMFLFGSFDGFNIQEIIEVLRAADDAYFNDESSFIDDGQYDALKLYAQQLSPSHPYFLGVGSSVRGGKVKLPHPMGSLTQAYHDDIQRWVNKHGLSSQPFVITEKLDGVSVLIIYDEQGRLQKAYSRGDGFEGADITRHISKIRSVPTRVASKDTMSIRAEAIISKANFEKVQQLIKTRAGQPYKNPRNMMAGLMNAESNPDIVYDFIDVIMYDVIVPDTYDKQFQLEMLADANECLIPQYVVVDGNTLTDDYLSALINTMREESAYEIDGIVIEVDNAASRKSINPTKETLNPEYARKYKVADASNLTIATVVDVEWNTSKDGYLKPRVKLEPVKLMGVTVQHASGFNAKFIVDNGIGPGAKVKITRSGDVIPYILECVEPIDNVFTPDGVWTSTGVDLVVKDADSNETVKFEQLNDFFTTIDVPSLKDGNIQTLFSAGFKAPEDVINLMEDELCSLLGRAIGKKVFKGIREKFTNIPEYVLMGAHPAFGRGIGVRKMKKLYEAFCGDTSRISSIIDVMNVDGFDHKTASKIANGYSKYQAFRANVFNRVSFAPYQAPKQGSFTGQTVVFTGFRSKELEQQIVDAGGTIGSSVSSKTTLVVADDPTSTSGKAAKARELNIKLIDVAQLREML